MKWTPPPQSVLSIAEVLKVRAVAVGRRRSPSSRVSAVIFELAAVCGLRASEIAGLQWGDLKGGADRPYIQVRRRTKGGKSRVVPLWWFRNTAHTLAEFEETRKTWERSWGRMGKTFGSYPVVCSTRKGSRGRALDRHQVYRRWARLLAAGLGKARAAAVPLHGGRHTSITHVRAARGPEAAQFLAGHARRSTTDAYTHLLGEDFDRPGDVFIIKGQGSETVRAAASAAALTRPPRHTLGGPGDGFTVRPRANRCKPLRRPATRIVAARRAKRKAKSSRKRRAIRNPPPKR